MRGTPAHLLWTLTAIVAVQVLPLAGSDLVVVDTSGKSVPDVQVRIEGREYTVTAPGFLPASGRLDPSGGVPERVVLERPATLSCRIASLGARLARARVAVTKTGTPAAEHPAVRDATNGRCTFADLRSGRYKVRVEAAQHIPVDRTVRLREGEAGRVRVDLLPAGWVEARLADAAGMPVPDVEARILTEGIDGRFLPDEEKPRLAGLLARSDVKGAFRLGPLGCGLRHRLAFRRPGFAPVSIIAALPDPGPTRRQVVLPREGRIRIALADPDDRPVSGGSAALASDDVADVDLVPRPAPSDANGVLEIGGLPPGLYALRLTTERFRPRTLRGVQVREGATTEVGKVRLDPGSEIAGTVREVGGSPLSGASVRAAYHEEGRRLRSEATTDSEGRFRIGGLPPGETTIEAEAEGYLPGSRSKAAAEPGDLVLELLPACALEGRVLDAETGGPIDAFEVELLPMGADAGRGREIRAPSVESFLDPEGRFRIRDLRPDRYAATIRARGYVTGRVDDVEACREPPEPVGVRLERGAAVEGIVRDALSGEPVAGAAVRARELLPEETDAEGRFRIQGLAGSVDLSVEHPHYVPESVPVSRPGARAPIEILLRPGGRVEGVVYSMETKPLPAAVVTARFAAGARHTTADAEGRYRIQGLPAGKVVLSKVDVPGTHRGYETAVVDVRPAGATRHDFGLGVRLEGVVTHEGTPAPGAVVTLAHSPTEMPPGIALAGTLTARSREDGSYTAAGLRPGEYGFLVIWEGRRLGKRVRVPEGVAVHRLDVEIPDLWLSGQVIDLESGAPLDGTVLATLKGGEDPRSAYTVVAGEEDGEILEFSSNPGPKVRTDEAGRFRLPLPEPGTYGLLALAAGYTMAEPVEVAVDASRSDVVLGLLPAVQVRVTATDAGTRKLMASGCAVLVAESTSLTTCGPFPLTVGPVRPGPALVAAGAAGRTFAYAQVTLEDADEELAFPLGEGGMLRVWLPETARAEPGASPGALLGVFDSRGIELTRLFSSLLSLEGPWIRAGPEGQFIVDHAPPGPLVLILREVEEESTRPARRVEVPEGGEATADLR
jgi:hypothetical protein